MSSKLGRIDGWWLGEKALTEGESPFSFLLGRGIMCPRSHASIHSRRGGEPPQKPKTKHKGGGSDKGGWGRCRGRYDE